MPTAESPASLTIGGRVGDAGEPHRPMPAGHSHPANIEATLDALFFPNPVDEFKRDGRGAWAAGQQRHSIAPGKASDRHSIDECLAGQIAQDPAHASIFTTREIANGREHLIVQFHRGSHINIIASRIRW